MSSNEMKNAIQFFITNKNCIDFHKASGNLGILNSSKIDEKDYIITIEEIKSDLAKLGDIVDWTISKYYLHNDNINTIHYDCPYIIGMLVYNSNISTDQIKEKIKSIVNDKQFLIEHYNDNNYLSIFSAKIKVFFEPFDKTAFLKAYNKNNKINLPIYIESFDEYVIKINDIEDIKSIFESYGNIKCTDRYIKLFNNDNHIISLYINESDNNLFIDVEINNIICAKHINNKKVLIKILESYSDYNKILSNISLDLHDYWL